MSKDFEIHLPSEGAGNSFSSPSFACKLQSLIELRKVLSSLTSKFLTKKSKHEE